MRILPFLFAFLAAAPLAAQTPSYSRFDFGNAYRTDREDFFPNSRSAQGNQSGDFLYKAFPAEVFARDGKIRVSGVRITFTVDKSYKGTFPAFVQIPEIAFFPLVKGTVAGGTFDLPDVARRSSKSLPEAFRSFSRGGVQVYEITLGPHQPDPRLRVPIELDGRDSKGELQGWAIGLMAPIGTKQGDGMSNFVCVPTFREVHRVGAPTSFSGMWDARAKVFRPYGTKGAPSNIGELAIELLLDQPTLQVFSDAAGGVRKDARRVETHMGPGAYVNHLASSVVPGFFGLYTQWEGKEKDDIWALPIVTATGAKMPAQRIAFGGATILWDPMRASSLDAFLVTGNLGRLIVYKAGSQAGHGTDQNGVYATVRIPVPQDKSLAGLTLWVQSVLAEAKSGAFPAATNLVRLVF